MFGGCFVSIIGSLAAAWFNLFFFASLDQGIVPQFYPDVVMVSSVILTIFLFILLRNNLTRMLFPTIRFNEPLDTSAMANRCKMLADTYGLTPRERDLLVFFSEGRDMPYIEKKLMISRSTAKTHTTHIYQKVGVTSRQELLDLLRD
jgi:DNA-binding CsgD family transcriptional regulator